MNIFEVEKTDFILDKALHGQRISKEEALELLRFTNFLKIQSVASRLREKILPIKNASYTIFRVINYTNYCNVECSFCSFMDEIDSGKGYVLSLSEIQEKMDYAIRHGANAMFFQGGVYPELKFDYYVNILQGIKKTFPQLHIRGFSPVELLGLTKITNLSLIEVLKILKDAGLDSVPGAGAEILTERMRNIISPKKASVEDWSMVMRTCHKVGLPGTANIVFGSSESDEEIIEHLSVIRDIQDSSLKESSIGFLSFIPWTFQPQTKKFFCKPVPTHKYLKVLGISRIFLDNIKHLETSVMVLGKGVGQLALYSGADDISSVVIEENVLRSFGLKTEKEAVQFLEGSGFEPLKRDLLYNYK